MFFGNDATKLIKNFFNVLHSPIFRCTISKLGNSTIYSRKNPQFCPNIALFGLLFKKK